MMAAGKGSSQYTTEDQEFTLGDQPLTGTLYLPEGAGWYPAVVLVGESSHANEDAQLTRFLLTLGFAVLTFDAQGNSRAQAALAAADSLLMRPDIRPELIGLLGLGAGAWAAAHAAARAPETAFVVVMPVNPPSIADLPHLSNLDCPILAVADEVTATALTPLLAHNPDVTILRVSDASLGSASLTDDLGSWLQRQAS